MQRALSQESPGNGDATTKSQLFAPCTNLRTGGRMLTAEYQRAAAGREVGQEALQQALSEYNSGSSTVGFDNGYVSSVVNGGFILRSSPRRILCSGAVMQKPARFSRAFRICSPSSSLVKGSWIGIFAREPNGGFNVNPA